MIDTLQVWDMQLLEYGRHVIKKRREFVNDLNEIIPVSYTHLDVYKRQACNNAHRVIYVGALHCFFQIDMLYLVKSCV